MCAKSYVIIQESRYGRIRRSRCCKKFKVEIGNVLVTLSQTGFDRFREFVWDITPETIDLSGVDAGGRRRLAIELHPTGICLTVDRTELVALRDLLRGAQDYLELLREPAEPVDN